MTIRVYIVEDHPVMRETLREYLVLDGEIEVCGESADAEAASDRIGPAAPDVVLLDLSLPGRSGLEFLEEIRDRWGTPCVILSGHRERTYVRQALASGAGGYVLKGRPQDLAVALRSALKGDVFLSEGLHGKALGAPAADADTGPAAP